MLSEAEGGSVSTGGPGETGGTGYSVEMMSILAYSGTEKTPERCFGNSGENWSADNPMACQARLSLHPMARSGASCLEAPDSAQSPGCAAAPLQHPHHQQWLPQQFHWFGHCSAVGEPVGGLLPAVGGLQAADVGSVAAAGSF